MIEVRAGLLTRKPRNKKLNLNHRKPAHRMFVGAFLFPLLCLSSLLCGCIGTEEDEEEFFSSKGHCGPNQSHFSLALTTDSYGYETNWKLVNRGTGRQIASGPPGNRNYADKTTYIGSYCLPNGSYQFVIDDESGDGMCCRYGQGRVVLRLDDKVINNPNQSGRFDHIKRTNFSVRNNSNSSNNNSNSSNNSSYNDRDQRWVNAHNTVRRREHRNAGIRFGAVRWNNDLEQDARDWASDLLRNRVCEKGLRQMDNNGHERGVPEGENITQLRSGSINTPENVVSNHFMTRGTLQHKNQVRWHSTEEIGCSSVQGNGSSSQGNCVMHVCRYWPPGNVRGMSWTD
jgi:hypothetical protein